MSDIPQARSDEGAYRKASPFAEAVNREARAINNGDRPSMDSAVNGYPLPGYTISQPGQITDSGQHRQMSQPAQTNEFERQRIAAQSVIQRQQEIFEARRREPSQHHQVNTAAEIQQLKNRAQQLGVPFVTAFTSNEYSQTGDLAKRVYPGLEARGADGQIQAVVAEVNVSNLANNPSEWQGILGQMGARPTSRRIPQFNIRDGMGQNARYVDEGPLAYEQLRQVIPPPVSLPLNTGANSYPVSPGGDYRMAPGVPIFQPGRTNDAKDMSAELAKNREKQSPQNSVTEQQVSQERQNESSKHRNIKTAADMKRAKDRAKELGVPLVTIISSDSCGYCHQLTNEAYPFLERKGSDGQVGAIVAEVNMDRTNEYSSILKLIGRPPSGGVPQTNIRDGRGQNAHYYTGYMPYGKLKRLIPQPLSLAEVVQNRQRR